MRKEVTVVIGEALIDVVRDVRGGIAEYVGGSPLNVAIGLARLDHPVSFVTRVGEDARGDRICAHLEASDVQLAAGSVTACRTATAQATLDSAGSATYEFDIDWDLEGMQQPPPPRCAHTGSIAGVMEPGSTAVAELLDNYRGSATISYDPNVRPDLFDDAPNARERIRKLVSLADIVKVSDEDLRWFDPADEPETTAQQWLSSGVAVVVVTAGADGAFALSDAGRVDVTARNVQVVDTVGAGDAFMAGLLDGFAAQDLLGADRRDLLRAVDRSTLLDVMTNATTASALTVSKAGADLPTRRMLTDAVGLQR
ncbi:carbohydrate kinase [Rhodococcus sp. NPDC058521]|uniref:carbohydrate kinase family protein n=1 Tax=Rhodococcus sp. NPDC058521 TaxID=3346536 RepID=UPI003652748C